MSLKGKNQKFKVLRGEGDDAEMEDYELELDEGMVVLDCMHRIQSYIPHDILHSWFHTTPKSCPTIPDPRWRTL